MRDRKRLFLRFLKPLLWIISRIIRLIPSYGDVQRGIELQRDIRALEKSGNHDEARKLRREMLYKYPVKHLGPLWRSEGSDQLYNLKNYDKALKAFENAISAIEGDSMICAFQYGVTDPFKVYFGAAVSAFYVSEKEKARIYGASFLDLLSKLESKERFNEQVGWLNRNIGDLAPTIN